MHVMPRHVISVHVASGVKASCRAEACSMQCAPPARLVRAPPQAKSKRQRRCHGIQPSFVAVRAPGSAEEGFGERVQPWRIIGFAEFQRAECFTTPSRQDMELLEKMQVPLRSPISNYELPVAAVVSTSGLLQTPVDVELPAFKRIAAVPGVAFEKVLRSTVAGTGQTLQQLVGPPCCQWQVWKCNDIHASLTNAMRAQSQFRWPLFPADARAVGIDVPDQQLPFAAAQASPSSPRSSADDEDEGYDDAEASDDDHAGCTKQAYVSCSSHAQVLEVPVAGEVEFRSP